MLPLDTQSQGAKKEEPVVKEEMKAAVQPVKKEEPTTKEEEEVSMAEGDAGLVSASSAVGAAGGLASSQRLS